MERLDYFLRRLLLMVPTFVGITFACFALCQVVPGGPVEQALASRNWLVYSPTSSYKFLDF